MWKKHDCDIPQNALRWRHNGRDSVSNHQPHDCLLNRLFRRRSKKTSKLRVTGLCAGNSPGPVNSPHKGPVTRKMFPFDDVIMDRESLQNDRGGHPNHRGTLETIAMGPSIQLKLTYHVTTVTWQWNGPFPGPRPWSRPSHIFFW